MGNESMDDDARNSNAMIIKASGEREPFSEEKYRRSLHRSGLSDKDIDDVMHALRLTFHETLSTRDLYGKTFEYLREKKRHYASRYALKDGLRLLGPTGFPFERLAGDILQKQGYSIERDQILQGHCIAHEIDLIAHNSTTRLIVECKFHNRVGLKSDVHTTLYTKARYDDINANMHDSSRDRCMVVTNTKFTTQAIQYGTCVGILLLAWGYPQDNGIERLIEKYGLYPISVLTFLRGRERRTLLDGGIILCQQILDDKGDLRKLGFSGQKIHELQEECRELCMKKSDQE